MHGHGVYQKLEFLELNASSRNPSTAVLLGISCDMRSFDICNLIKSLIGYFLLHSKTTLVQPSKPPVPAQTSSLLVRYATRIQEPRTISFDLSQTDSSWIMFTDSESKCFVPNSCLPQTGCQCMNSHDESNRVRCIAEGDNAARDKELALPLS